MKITETDTLIIYETDLLEPPLEANMPRSRYAVGENGEPIQLPPDTRMVTTRGYLNLKGKSRVRPRS